MQQSTEAPPIWWDAKARPTLQRTARQRPAVFCATVRGDDDAPGGRRVGARRRLPLPDVALDAGWIMAYRHISPADSGTGCLRLP